MYEARRQRSSWARIKLSIVRKLWFITPKSNCLAHLQSLLCFYVVLSFAFELTSLFVFSYSVFNVQSDYFPSGSKPQSQFIIFAIYFVWVWFGVLFVITIFLTQKVKPLRSFNRPPGGFLTWLYYLITSKFIVNYYFFEDLQSVTLHFR